MGNQAIDFVMLWVNGNDTEWQKEKVRYNSLLNESNADDNGDCRFRDWDNLQFWFRGVEKYAKWVNRVFFVTNGQIPQWLNLKAKKLVFVKHSDYIPEDSLPTFNSHVIELNLNRIEELSNNFIYFNDDTFITSQLKEGMFFRDDIPVHPAELRPIIVNRDDSLLLAHVYMNMIHVINRNFTMNESIKANRSKWFALSNCRPKSAFLNLMLSQYRAFPGFRSYHLPVPIKKTTMQEVWTKENLLLSETTRHRFRTSDDVSQFLFRYWDLASGNFMPVKGDRLGKYFGLDEKNKDSIVKKICEAIEKSKYPMVCINDCFVAHQCFEDARDKVNKSLEKLFPDKSSFEL